MPGTFAKSLFLGGSLAALLLAGCGQDQPAPAKPPAGGGVRKPGPGSTAAPASPSADDPAALAPKAGEPLEASVERFKKTDMTMKVMRKNLTALALAKDPRAFKMLAMLCDDPQFSIAMALEALGQVDRPEVKPAAAEKARAHFGDRDIQAVGAALTAYAKLKGDAAVGDLSTFVRQNWARPDGYGEQVCSSAVKALGEVGSPASTAALIAELRRVTEPGWLPDYGSVAVATLARQRKDPEVRAALVAYAEGLMAKMPGPDNPPGRKYIEGKIAEARAAAEGLPPQLPAPAPAPPPPAGP